MIRPPFTVPRPTAVWLGLALATLAQRSPAALQEVSDESSPRFQTRMELWVGAAAVDFAVAELGGAEGLEVVVQTREPGRLHVWSSLSPELGGKPDGASVDVAPFGVGPVVWPARGDESALILISEPEPTALVAFTPRWRESLQRFDLERGAQRELAGQVRALAVDRLTPDAEPLLAVALADHAAAQASLALFDWPEPVADVPLGDELPTCLAFAPRSGRIVIGCQRGPSLRLVERTDAGFVETAAAPLPGIPRALVELELDGDEAPELLIVGGDDAVWALGFESAAGFAEDAADGRLDTLVTWRSGGIPIDVLAWPTAVGQRSAVTVLSWADMILASAAGFERSGPVAPDVRYAGLSPRHLGQGDLDGDGFADLLASNPDSGTISIWFGAQGGLPAAERLPAPATPFSLQAGDLDEDGRPDLVTLSAIEPVAMVRLSSTGESRRIPCAAGAARCALADVDGDGHTDLALLHEARAVAGIEVLFGDGRGALAARSATPPLAIGRDAVTLAAGDLDGRAGAELLAVLGADGELVQIGLEDGRLVVRERLALDGQGGGIVLECEADGRVRHLAVAESSPNAARLRLWATDGRGALSEVGRIALPRPAGALALGDVDGDGRTDLAVAMNGISGTQPGSLLTVRSAFAGEDQRRDGGLVLTGPNPRSIALADLDRDGRDEVLATSLGWNHLRLWTWSPTPGEGLVHGWDLGAHRACLEVLCLDLEGDGELELIVCNNFSSDLSVIRLAR